MNIHLRRSLTFTALLLTTCLARDICDLNPSTYNFELGSITGTVIYDGPHTSETNAFDATDEQIKKEFDGLFRPSFPFIYSRNGLVLDMPGRRVVVDPGALNAMQRVPLLQATNDPATFMDNLKAAGIKPKTVDAVLLTHGHHDHMLGLIDENGKANFPKADVYMGEKEHNFWMSLANPPEEKADAEKCPADAEGKCEEAAPEKPALGIPPALIAQAVKAYQDCIAPYQKAGKFHLVPTNGSPFDNVTFIPAFGDTPGHNVIEVASDDKRMLIIADTWISTPDQLQNPSWNYKLSFIPQLALSARMSILSRAARGGDLVLAFHEPFPGLGYVKTNGETYSWVPWFTQKLGIGVKKNC